MAARIKLGDRAHDTISGFQGIVIGRAVYLHGVPAVLIAPPVIERGAPAESQWIAESRVRRGLADGRAGFHGERPPTK